MTIDDTLDKILAGLPDMFGETSAEEAKSQLKLLLERVEVEAVKELRRRWDEDRKTMDYSPATYLFICDKYVAELSAKQGDKTK